MRFDPTDLRLFLAVLDAGSITHGAAEAGLSLPAASERLRDMEATGGIRLLERGRRGVTPTEAGEALAHHARLILRQLDLLRAELALSARSPRATVRLAANTAAITGLLPERLATWMAANPRVDIELKERQSPAIAKAVASGFAELGILSRAVDTTGLELRPFALDRLVVVLSRDHPLAAHKRVRLADILDQPFIGLAGGALQEHIDAKAAKLGAKPRVRLHLRTFDGICRLAASGVGLGIVPEREARRCRRSTKLATLRLTDPWAIRRLSLCIRDPEALTTTAQALLEHLAARTSRAV